MKWNDLPACADCNFSTVSRNAPAVCDDDDDDDEDDDEEELEGRRSTERISSSTRRRPSPGFEARAKEGEKGEVSERWRRKV